MGGAPVNSALLAQIQHLSVPVFSTYGMTETVSHIALRKLNGIGASETYMLLEGVEADTDERNCLRLRGAVTNHEWIQTNDVVVFDNKTHFQIIGRADNIINSGGVKIQLEKVERAIEQIWNRSERFFVWVKHVVGVAPEPLSLLRILTLTAVPRYPVKRPESSRNRTALILTQIGESAAPVSKTC